MLELSHITKTFGDFKTVLKRSMSLVMKTRNLALSHAYAKAKQCLWTLLNLMPVQTSSL